jgi:hypothetical protein
MPITLVVAPTSSVSIESLKKRELDALLLGTNSVTQYLLAGSLKGFWSVDSNSTLPNRITLCARSLEARIQQILTSNEDMDIHKVARFLGIRELGIKHLVKNGYLRWQKYQRVDDSTVEIKSLNDFMDIYICINRESLLKGVSTELLIDRVQKCCGITPFLRNKAYKYDIEVILFRKSDLRGCCITVLSNKLEVCKKVRIRPSSKIKCFCNIV